MSSSADTTAQAPAAGQAAKKIRSQPPDVIVSVGSGKTKREFQCYKVILSFASDYLDTMLNSSMKICLRLPRYDAKLEHEGGDFKPNEFPDKVPEEWEMLYEFIAPQKIGRSRHNSNANINSDNVMTLLPWFHEFQMNDYVRDCDDYIAQHFIGEEGRSFWKYERHQNELISVYWPRKKRRKEAFGTILNVLQLAHKYDLVSSKDVMGKKIAAIWKMSVHTHDLFGFPVARSLLSLVLPLEIDGENKLRMKSGGSKHIWPLVEKTLSPHIPRLSQEVIDDNVSFPHLFYSFVLINMEKERMQQEIDMLEDRELNAQNEISYLHEWLSNLTDIDVKRAYARFQAQQNA
eukprot:CAMPEP_0181091424 /NCGR_PEP_ID=MMETSP1071-20121207/8392_1 /TAXON_ID=35127 /ORGANISM="Thalassiosira sp., Strain NH16" /LENGTH=346 /DNA_ID=CAMNT_0023173565 /DNA_START=519 /DNA_END=1560 /DNA_ORIENTATION=+